MIAVSHQVSCNMTQILFQFVLNVIKILQTALSIQIKLKISIYYFAPTLTGVDFTWERILMRFLFLLEDLSMSYQYSAVIEIDFDSGIALEIYAHGDHFARNSENFRSNAIPRKNR